MRPYLLALSRPRERDSPNVIIDSVLIIAISRREARDLAVAEYGIEWEEAIIEELRELRESGIVYRTLVVSYHKS